MYCRKPNIEQLVCTSIGSHSVLLFFSYQGQIVDPEMLARWTVMGAFLPWFRNHYDNYYKPYQEPYMYAEPVPSICRKYIEMRYQLIQYIYDAMYENTQTGKPICRPLFMDEIKPGKASLSNWKRQIPF